MTDSMTLNSPLLMSLAIYLSYWLLTRSWRFLFINRLLAASILTVLQILLTELALGLGRMLTAFYLQMFNGLIIFLILIFSFLQKRSSQETPSHPILRPSFSEGLLFLLVIVVYALIAFLNTLVPPYDWDSLTYHLVDVLYSAQEKTVGVFPYPTVHYFFPKVGELYALWIYLLGGGDSNAFRHLNIVQAPFALLASIALVSSSHSLGFKKSIWISIPLFVLTPVIMIQSLTTMVDVICAAFFLAALAFILLFLKNRNLIALRLACISWGLLIGTKFTFLYLSLPLLPLFLFGRIRVILTIDRVLRPMWRNLIILLACLFLGFGYWVTRNLIWAGNPIYPTLVKIGERTLFEGHFMASKLLSFDRLFVQNPIDWFTYPFMEKIWGQFLYTHENGFGPQFLLALICSIWGGFIAWKRGNKMVLWTLLVIPLTILLWLYPHPYHSPRYIIAVCGIAILGFNFLNEVVGRRLRLVLHGMAWITILFSVTASVGELTPKEAQALHVFKHTGKAPSLREYYSWGAGQFAESWEWLSQNTKHGETIVITNNQLIVPLFGWENQNRLIWISTRENHPYVNITMAQSFLEWKKKLKEIKAHFVYVLDMNWEGYRASMPSRWVTHRTDDFQLIRSWEGSHYVAIYKILYPEIDLSLQRYEKANLPLEDLSRNESWSVTYEENSTLNLSGREEGGSGILLQWNFKTSDNDYGELAAYPDQTDWEAFRTLSFSLYHEGVKDLLFIYLKNPNSKEYERFRISLAGLKLGWNVIELDLRNPERKSSHFTLKNINSIHLVIDDDPDERIGSGKIEIKDFQGIPDLGTGASK